MKEPTLAKLTSRITWLESKLYVAKLEREYLLKLVDELLARIKKLEAMLNIS